MPIKGIVLIFLIMIVAALVFRKEIYSEAKKIFTDKKDEDMDE